MPIQLALRAPGLKPRSDWRSAQRPSDAHISQSVFSPPPYEGGGGLSARSQSATADFASPDGDFRQRAKITALNLGSF